MVRSRGPPPPRGLWAPTQSEPLAAGLAGEFYVDSGIIRDAIRRRASFNVVHLATMFKADVFVGRDDAWSREEMAQARAEEIETPAGRAAVRFAGPEDTLLHTLPRYRRGGEVLDRQWGDVVGVVRVEADALDATYPRRRAGVLDVSDLPARAWQIDPLTPRGRARRADLGGTSLVLREPSDRCRESAARSRPGSARAGTRGGGGRRDRDHGWTRIKSGTGPGRMTAGRASRGRDGASRGDRADRARASRGLDNQRKSSRVPVGRPASPLAGHLPVGRPYPRPRWPATYL